MPEQSKMIRPHSSVIGDVSLSGSRNVILRVGRRHDEGWTQTEHLVLSPAEWRALVERVAKLRAV